MRYLFISGGDKRRARRDIQPEYRAAENWNDTGISPTSSQWHSFSTISPTLNNDDVNITMLCESYWFSCRGRCTQERELGGTEERLQCFCDNSCEMFQDCCADFDQFCSSTGTLTEEAENPDYEHWKCIESHLLTEARGVWMIASCPTNWTQEDIDERCWSSFASLSYDNHKDNLPVMDHTGNTYKNRYCAQCHGLNLDDLTFYNLLFNCHVPAPSDYQSNDILQFLFAFCDEAYWKSPEGTVRRYCYGLTDGCPDCFPPTRMQEKCRAGSLRLVYVNDTGTQQNFINPYCALINNAKNIGCGPGSSKPQSEPPEVLSPKPFSLVMNIDFSDEQTGKETSSVRIHKVSCLEGNVYDFHLQVCRPGISPTEFNSVHQELLSVSLWMRSKISSSSTPLVTEINSKEAIVDKLNISETFLSVVSIGNPFGPVSTVVLNIEINPTTKKNLSMKTVRTALSHLSVQLNNASFTVFKIAVKRFDCASIASYKPYEYTVENRVVKIRDTGEIILEENYYTNETEWINGSLVPVGTLTVCKKERVNCSGVLVRLNESEYVILINGSLYRNISRELFEPERFLSINNTTWVCAHFSSSYEAARNTTETKKNIVLVLLTFIGLSVSIVSFVAVLVTYALFKELRTLPGTNLMNLSLAHLLADLFYLATGYVDAGVACTIIAILLHYFFLVSLTWMSVMAFETWVVFSKILIQKRNQNKREKCFNLLGRTTLGWLPAFVFVVMCVALDQSNAVAFHYGGIKGCWINNSTANMFFFVVPVALSISFNTIFFALTVRAIRNTTKQTQRATHQTLHRKNAVVFLKIFILTGFTWTFGILKIAVSEYFEYPFIIFTTLQGLYVLLAFVFTTRVKRMYCALLCIDNKLSEGQESTLRTKRELVPPVVLLKHVGKKEA